MDRALKLSYSSFSWFFRCVYALSPRVLRVWFGKERMDDARFTGQTSEGRYIIKTDRYGETGAYLNQ
ncbi:hypothetical protein ACSFC1_03360 [Pseudothermotoga sp. U03pept]|uniref:hypothetical protein n=1 Tax=Pseudothermotoga sp. U03pept TaxID=3447012 RepID=UPI003F0DAC5F